MWSSIRPIALNEEVNDIDGLTDISLGVEGICQRLLVVNQCSTAIE